MSNRMIYLKEETRQKIVEGATELFTKEGLFDVQMTDIAKHVGVSRHTLYRYFQDKSDLALTIAKKIIELVFIEKSTAHYEGIKNSGLNGWQKLKYCFEALWVTDRLENEFRFMAEFDSYYSSSRLSEELINKLNSQIDPFTTKLWLRIIEDGINDGSIRDDKEPQLLLITLLNSVRGLNQRIILRGNGLVETENSELSIMLNNFLELIFDGIKKKEI